MDFQIEYFHYFAKKENSFNYITETVYTRIFEDVLATIFGIYTKT
jgi:hypothetical protein